jgi:predicted permease
MAAAASLFGAFVLGLGARSRLRRHFAVLFRAQFAGGLGVLALFAGWGFDVTVRNVAALAILLAVQLTSVLVASRVFRGRADGALVAFGMFGNPTYWALPVATATVGAHAAIFLVAYDMLTQPRISVGVRLMRGRAPEPQPPSTALTDYAPSVAAVAGLAFGFFVPAPDAIDTIVAVLGVAVACTGALLLGVAWPREWIGRNELRSAAPGLAFHLTLAPALLALATLAGADLPAAVWFVAFGPLPVSVVPFARLYGFSVPNAATAFALSTALAVALLPLALLAAG